MAASYSGAGIGIHVALDIRTNVTIRNGAVAGMGANEITLGNQGVIENVQVRWNRQSEIEPCGAYIDPSRCPAGSDAEPRSAIRS